MYYSNTATSTSADFLVFIVTIHEGLPRPHGINHTSFIVYLPNLRIKVTVAFGNFTVVCQLVRLIRLCIRFLFVRPRIRYCFFSPKRHHLKLASRYRVRRQLRPEWTFTFGREEAIANSWPDEQKSNTKAYQADKLTNDSKVPKGNRNLDA